MMTRDQHLPATPQASLQPSADPAKPRSRNQVRHLLSATARWVNGWFYSDEIKQRPLGEAPRHELAQTPSTHRVVTGDAGSGAPDARAADTASATTQPPSDDAQEPLSYRARAEDSERPDRQRSDGLVLDHEFSEDQVAFVAKSLSVSEGSYVRRMSA